MLSKADVVQIRTAVESLYDGKCTITEHQKVRKENGSTGFQDVVVHEDVPCRLTYSTIKSTNPGDTASTLVQVVKVFLSPDIRVKPGSKMTITQNDVTTEYKSSGEPGLYKTHQEIILEIFERWS